MSTSDLIRVFADLHIIHLIRMQDDGMIASFCVEIDESGGIANTEYQPQLKMVRRENIKAT